MKVLITGANGFLGYYLAELLLAKGCQVIATGKGECRLPFSANGNFVYESMDFTIAAEAGHLFDKHNPHVVVHTGAISKPDECELQKEMARNINVNGTAILLQAAKKHKSHFIFMSTDFVFNGERGMYKEEDKPGPVNYYGQTKLEGEELVQEYPFDWSIVRTVLVYGRNFSGRTNLLLIVKDKLKNGEAYKVLCDQVRTPTYVGDLAAGIASIIEKKATGIYHLSGKDVMTPYEMAVAVADYLKMDAALLHRATRADFKEPALRPLKTGFVIEKAKNELGYNPVSFQEGLQLTFNG